MEIFDKLGMRLEIPEIRNRLLVYWLKKLKSLSSELTDSCKCILTSTHKTNRKNNQQRKAGEEK